MFLQVWANLIFYPIIITLQLRDISYDLWMCPKVMYESHSFSSLCSKLSLGKDSMSEHEWKPWMCYVSQSFSSPGSCSMALNPPNSLIQLETRTQNQTCFVWLVFVFFILKKEVKWLIFQGWSITDTQSMLVGKSRSLAKRSFFLTGPLSPSSQPHLFQIDLIPCQQFKPLPWQHQSRRELQIQPSSECSELAAFQATSGREACAF